MSEHLTPDAILPRSGVCETALPKSIGTMSPRSSGQFDRISKHPVNRPSRSPRTLLSPPGSTESAA